MRSTYGAGSRGRCSSGCSGTGAYRPPPAADRRGRGCRGPSGGGRSAGAAWRFTDQCFAWSRCLRGSAAWSPVLLEQPLVLTTLPTQENNSRAFSQFGFDPSSLDTVSQPGGQCLEFPGVDLLTPARGVLTGFRDQGRGLISAARPPVHRPGMGSSGGRSGLGLRLRSTTVPCLAAQAIPRVQTTRS